MPDDVFLTPTISLPHPIMNEHSVKASSLRKEFLLREVSHQAQIGLSTEFLKFFWCDLGTEITNSFNNGILKWFALKDSQRRGIILLIPKQDIEKTFLENLRSITLSKCRL